jgi:hypothetical protein
LAILTLSEKNFTGKTRYVCGLARLDLRKNNLNHEKDAECRLYRSAYTTFSIVVATLCISIAKASPILSDQYSLIDLSGGDLSSRTFYRALDGTTVSSSSTWSNGSLYHVGYLVDSSETFDPITGEFIGNINTGSSAHGWLARTASAARVIFIFPDFRNIDLIRAYTSSRLNYTGSDYAFDYWNGSNWINAVSRQGNSNNRSSTEYFDHEVDITTSRLRLTAYDGHGAPDSFRRLPGFGKVQLFGSAITSVTSPNTITLFGLAIASSFWLKRKKRIRK